MVDAVTGDSKVVIFVLGGQRTEVMVPLGTYQIRYASGNTWYGENYLFGPETDYTKTDEDFAFRRTSNGYSGYTVTLYKVEHGNLSTTPIRPEDF
jgi:hypothetical protein